MIRSVQQIDGGRVLLVEWQDGFSARFHALWLRDNAGDAKTRDVSSGQRNHTILDLSPETRCEAASVSEEGELQTRFAPDGHEVAFSADWLRANHYDRPDNHRSQTISPPPGVEPWQQALSDRLPRGSYAEIASDESALADWLTKVERYGFAVLDDVPVRDGAIFDVVDLFGFVRETNYGRLFDVRTEINPSNLAFTNRALQVHTDNPYRRPVPTLQLLHCLEAAGEGGDSVVIDGFSAALMLAERAPEHFDALCSSPVPFEYKGSDGTHLCSGGPLIEVDRMGVLRSVRFNNRSMAPMGLPFDETLAFYEAYRAFAEVLERPELRVTFRLAPGSLFVVDNTRVMHGRTGYESDGHRHLQGCYADIDGLASRRRELQAKATASAAAG